MPTVRTTCPSCDTVLLDAGELTLRRSPDATQTECRFVCPDCVQVVVQPVSDKMVPVLIGAGCVVEEWAMGDAQTLHPSNGRITEDEIQAFVASLDADDWLAELLS